MTTTASPRLRRALLTAATAALACLLYAPALAQTGQWETNGANINNTNPGNVRVGGPGAAPSAVLHARGNLSSPVTGTVTVTQNSATVTGAGTAFNTELAVGDSVKIGAEVFTVAAIASATSLTLDSNYLGASAAGQAAFRDPNLFAVDTGDGANRLTVTRMGRLGIGTATPSSKLSVAETATLPNRGIGVAQYSTDATSALLNLTKLRGTPSAPSPAVDGDSVGSIFANVYTGGYLATAGINFLINGTVTPSAAPTDMVFRTGTTGYGNETMRLTSAGNLGIGTPAPAHKLHVFGGNVFHQFSTAAAQEWGFYTAIRNNHLVSNLYFDGQWKMMTAGRGAFIATSPLDGAAFNVLADNTSRAPNAQASFTSLMRVTMTGNVGVGTDAPAHKLDVAGNANASGLCIAGDCKTAWSQVGGATSQWTTSGANMYFNSGNVGVGTSDATARLHVVGANGASGAAAPTALSVVGGAGGNGQTAGGAGGDLSFLGGAGGWNTTGSSLYYSGNGGAISLTGGTGGQHLFGVAHAGTGGAVNINGGTGGPHTLAGYPGGAGGNIVLNGGTGGTGATAGAAGNVVLANLRGNVGVGTGAPTVKLDVAGQVRSSSGGFVFPDGSVQTTASSGGVTSVTAGAGLTGGGTGGAVTLTNSDRGSAQNIFKNVANAAGAVQFSAASNNDALRIEGTGGTTVSFDAASKKVTINSAAAGAASGWTDSGGSVALSTAADNVGIGTATPQAKLVVTGGPNTALLIGDRGTSGSVGLQFLGSGYRHGGVRFDGNSVVVEDASATHLPSTWHIAGQPVNFVVRKGNVGIGTTTPTEALDVVGNITATGNIAAKYQDVAEWVPSTQRLAAGTVVVLDGDRTNHVLASSESYDTRVAGVVSAQPGLILGEGGAGKLMVATTGRVRVKVDATRAPIKIGDLLVTGEVEGVAMKSEPITVGGRRMHAPGTIIGKALEPLEKGTGEILVLLSLQ